MRNTPRPARASALLAASILTLTASTTPAQPGTGEAGPVALTPELVSRFAGEMCVTVPSRKADMGFQQPTKIGDVLLRGGAEVRKGQVIVRGDDAEDQALLKLQKIRSETDLPVQRAKAEMDLAKVEYERLEDIRKNGGSSQQELERARLAYEKARLAYLEAQQVQTQEVLQLERLQARVDRFRIEAPFDGQIDQVMCDTGQAVSENEKIVRVVNVDPLWMDVPASTKDPRTHVLKPGDPAWVLVELAGVPRLRLAKVVEVAPTAELGSRSRRVRVELPNPKGAERMIAGEAAWVRFTEPPKDLALAAPAGPVVADNK